MRPTERIEQSIRRLHVEAGAERREQTLRDLVEAHTQYKEKTRAPGLRSFGRTIMRQRPRRIAAAIILGVLLVSMFGLGTGSVAFSQVGHAVNSTLSRLIELIVEIRTGELRGQAPLPATSSGDAAEQTPPAELRAVTCAARFFSVSEREQSVWQSLGEHGIELVQASSDPETYYATLTAEQAERFEDMLTTGPITTPRVMVAEGEQAMIATDVFALAWLPTISSDGERIESTFSFHDGDHGFEIPNLRTEEGGVILVRVKGIASASEDVLILLKVGQTLGGRQ
jgi:hypothetical protein